MSVPRSMQPRVSTVELFRRAPHAIIVKLAARVTLAQRSQSSLRKGI